MIRLIPVFALFFPLAVFSQYTLQFNRVVIFTADSGQVTVPAGKVWKIESISPSQGKRYGYGGNYGNISWGVSTPNPCTGATSGSTNVDYYYTVPCPSSTHAVFINGQEIQFPTNNILWLNAGSTVLIRGSYCYNQTSVSLGAGSVIRDQTNSTYVCGPWTLNAGQVKNSPVVTLIEFNLIP